MKIRKPIPHWNNFTIPELHKILEHCGTLERLGIAQDEEMMRSIERDIRLREKQTVKYPEFKPAKLASNKQQKRHSTKQHRQNYLLEQIV